MTGVLLMPWLASAGVVGPISLVGTATGTNTAGTGITVTLPGGVQAGDVVIFLSAVGNATAVNMTTAGYTLVADVVNGTTNRLRAFWKTMGSTPDTTAVVEGSGSAGAAATALVYVLRKVNTVTPMDATATTAQGSSGQPDSPSINTVTDGAWVISGVCASTSDTTTTVPSGYSDKIGINASAANSNTSAMARILKATAGAENPPAWSAFNSVPWSAFSLAIRPG